MIEGLARCYRATGREKEAVDEDVKSRIAFGATSKEIEEIPQNVCGFR
jgi:hypothetical protein